jgi:hypothetical protein
VKRSGLTTGFSEFEADNEHMIYTPCYVRMTWHCHQASYVVTDSFTNTLVFVMSDWMKALNPFLQRIPNELQEKYFTDYLTEVIKLFMGETNNKEDDGVLHESRNIVAFARKTGKLRPSI